LAAANGSHAVQELRALPVQLIDPNPSQPRQHFEETALHALADSIRERGVLQPVLVRPRSGGRYQLVAGERRWFAAQIAGLEQVPALVCRYDDAATLEVALTCQTLAELGLTHREIGTRVGRSGSAVANLRRLLNLSEDILQFIERGELGMAHGLALLVAKDAEVRRDLAGRAVKEGWTVLAIEARAREGNKGVAGPEEHAPGPRRSRRGGRQEQYLDQASLAVARGWGDLVGVEVSVRPMAQGRVRLEIQFNSPEAALDAARRLADAMSSPKGG
jgi:ParB family chromosome partitioning protein